MIHLETGNPNIRLGCMFIVAVHVYTNCQMRPEDCYMHNNHHRWQDC